MDYRLEQKDIDLLRTAGMNETDLDHFLKVTAKALEIARRTGAALDLELVGQAALFHDLGKTATHEISHGRIGAELGTKLGLPQTVTAIMEKHIRGGLTEPEAIELGLPVKDTLHRLEERIIIYADRLVDIIHDGIVEIKGESEAETRFVEILNEYPKYGKNEITLHRYLGYHEEIQRLIAGRIINAPRLAHGHGPQPRPLTGGSSCRQFWPARLFPRRLRCFSGGKPVVFYLSSQARRLNIHVSQKHQIFSGNS